MTTQTNLELSEVKAMFNGAPIEVVSLVDLELHAGTQQRSKENIEAREAYQEAMEAGEVENFPALRVVRLDADTILDDGSELGKGALILADGFTRVSAAETVGLETFRAEVVDGSLDAAVRFSWVANSMHGSKLDQKDYQKLISKIYQADPNIKKGDLARNLGCSAKTVSKAVKKIEDQFKSYARVMMDNGFSDKEIADKVHKSEQTVRNWREAYDAEKAQPEPEDKPVNPMKLKFEAVLALEDLEQQKTLLDMLQARYDENLKLTESEPQGPSQEAQEVEQCNGPTDTPETPQEATEEPEKAPWEDVTPISPADMTCWDILGRSKDTVAALANPKASLRRTLRTLSANGDSDEDVYQKAYNEALAELEG